MPRRRAFEYSAARINQTKLLRSPAGKKALEREACVAEVVLLTPARPRRCEKRAEAGRMRKVNEAVFLSLQHLSGHPVSSARVSRCYSDALEHNPLRSVAGGRASGAGQGEVGCSCQRVFVRTHCLVNALPPSQQNLF